MNTALMDAYEAVCAILKRRGIYDPQAPALRRVADLLLKEMEDDERKILMSREKAE